MRTGAVGEELDESRAASKRVGFRGPPVVLADRFDCRSRRAARGQERPGVKSARKRPRSSHPPLRSGAAKERRKPGHGRQSPGTGGGARVRGPSSRKGRGIERATRRWKASWADGSAAFDEAAGKAELVDGRRVERRGARRDKGCQRPMRTLRPRKTTPRNGGHPFEGSQISEPTRVSGAPATAGWRERERNRSKRVERRRARHGPACHSGFAPGG